MSKAVEGTGKEDELPRARAARDPLLILILFLPAARAMYSGPGGWGVQDFAGGTVVHINAGIAGLLACIMVGKREGYGTRKLAPHNVPMTLIGACMLWVGWFGFNAGSELAANGSAGMATLVTQIATAAAVLAWLAVSAARFASVKT